MKTFLVALLLALATAASAQQFIKKWHSFSDTVNGSYLHYVDPLGVVLLDGYLRGKLKGYRDDIKSEDVKFKPLPASSRPDKWDPRKDYFLDDYVEYGGKFYVSLNEPRPGTKPGSSEYWREVSLTGEAVSTRHSFPAAADSLKVVDFLYRFLEYTDVCPNIWDRHLDYYNDDLVLFNHKHYRCLRDNLGRQPDLSPDDWKLEASNMRFRDPSTLSWISVLYWQAEPAKLVPQMMNPLFFDVEGGYVVPSNLHFYYQDAIEYVASQHKLPMIYSSSLGYAGAPQLILGEKEVRPMMAFLVDNLRSGKLKLSRKEIADQALYDTLLSRRNNKPSPHDWRVMQDMLTNDLLVYYRSYNASKLAVRVSWLAVRNLITVQPVASGALSYQHALEMDVIHSESFALNQIDTLAPLSYKKVSMSAPASMYFIEERYAQLAKNPGLDIALTELWSRLANAANSKAIAEQQATTPLFPGNQPVPQMTFCTGPGSWTLEKGATLELPFHASEIDSERRKSPTIGFSVQYKRTLTDGKPLFEPVKLAVELLLDNNYSARHYFRWIDVMNVSAGDAKIAPLIHRVKTGQLMFDDSKIVYGLVGEW